MIQHRHLLLACICLSLTAHATKPKHRGNYEPTGGLFSLGLRNTVSAFSHGNPKDFGYGVGGQFRLQLADRINTEWYADILANNVYNKAYRYDYHIGWSVMYYLLHPKGFTRKLTPYVVAGHCFDYTRVRFNQTDKPPQFRWSSAVQAGLGCHYNITPRFDITFKTQYMLHLGNELHAHPNTNGEIIIEEHKNAGWEGHLLFTLSANYKLARLWKPTVKRTNKRL
jgi:hypothetical protein